ncbi:MAG: hypothetical protein KTR35_18475 [Gammaproteobacteria bacterium]|nr:hypothetical protein [Gammaproteobacteria bacterium]
MKQQIFMAVSISISLLTGSVWAGQSLVTNGNNDGPGSLRAALASGANTIRFQDDVQNINLTETLTRENPNKLRILGSGQSINASAIDPDSDILSISGAGDVVISDLVLLGSFDAVNEDPLLPAGGKGIEILVPVEAQGLIKVKISDLFLTRVGHHGIHISDCSLGDDCGGGSGGGGDGSSASLMLKLEKVQVSGVGFGRADADGVRVDERGDGSIYFTSKDSVFTKVGADGVELDEGNDGDVVSSVSRSLFSDNGEYCNLIPVFEGGPCDDDGDRDVDDGFDIDEAGEGGLYSRVRDSQVTNNFDEGLDFDEEDAGDIESAVIDTIGLGNQDEAFKMSEEGDGDLNVLLRKITTADNNGGKEGIELEEADDGNVAVRVVKSLMIGGEDEELKIEQADTGVGTVKVRNSNLGGLDLENVIEQ